MINSMFSDYKDLQKKIHKISINNLINILIDNNVKLNNIIVIPIINSTASNGSTILDFYKEYDFFYIKINVFKIRVFSKLEDYYLRYVHNEHYNLLKSLEDGVKSLLAKYMYCNENIIFFIKNNLYNSNYSSSLATVIKSIYNRLCEYYCLTVNYKQVTQEVYSRPSFVGKSYIGEIYLGESILVDYYLIEITVILPSFHKTQNNINYIYKAAQSVISKHNFSRCNVKINISESDKSTKQKIKYVGNIIIGSIK